jgi:hypothetical protein
LHQLSQTKEQDGQPNTVVGEGMEVAVRVGAGAGSTGWHGYSGSRLRSNDLGRFWFKIQILVMYNVNLLAGGKSFYSRFIVHDADPNIRTT